MNQRYIPKELTHFVGWKNPDDPEKCYITLTKILNQRELVGLFEPYLLSFRMLRASDTKFSSNDSFAIPAVCFCDIPIQDLNIHMNKYGQFGISFTKTHLLKHGANPVFYIAKNSMVHDWNNGSGDSDLKKIGSREEENDRILDLLFKLWEDILRIPQTSGLQESTWLKLRKNSTDAFNQLILNYIFFTKFFDASKDDNDKDNYYMEREWRLLGNLKFNLGDVRRVILLESYAARFHKDFPGYCGQITFAN